VLLGHLVAPGERTAAIKDVFKGAWVGQVAIAGRKLRVHKSHLACWLVLLLAGRYERAQTPIRS